MGKQVWFCLTVGLAVMGTVVLRARSAGAQGGSTWSASLTGNEVSALAVDATTHPATVYAGTTGGVFKSTDGSTWSSTGLTDGFVTALAVDATTHPATVYAATDGGVFSTDGSTWSAINTADYDYRRVYTLAVDATTHPATVYAGTYANMFDGAVVLKSTDRGKNWINVGNTALVSNAVFALAVDGTTHPATVYAAAGGNVFSTDGSTWKTINTSPSNNAIGSALVVTKHHPATVYAGTYGGVFRGTNRRKNWKFLPNDGSVVAALALDAAMRATVYAGTSDGNGGGGVFKSTNRGKNWINTGLTGTYPFYVNALAVDATTHPATVYVGTNGGVFKGQ